MASLINNLGGPAGFGQAIEHGNYTYATFDISSIFTRGLSIFGDTFDEIGVSTNGFVYFKDATLEPGSFRSDEIATYDGSTRIMAPFWSDIDTGLTPSSNPTASPGGTSQGTNTVYFALDEATQTITVTWDDVKPSPDGDDDITNAFQLRIIKTNEDGDYTVEFRYETIDWINPGGAYGDNALIGFSSLTTNVYIEHPLSSTNDLHFIENTYIDQNSEAGLIRYSFSQGEIVNAGAVTTDHSYGIDDDIMILQHSEIASQGAGDDVYILAGPTVTPGAEITISDISGNNTLQLIEGLTITDTMVASDALMLTTSTNATITILSASNFTYELGGTPLTAAPGILYDFSSFSQNILGVNVPTTGVIEANGFTVGEQTSNLDNIQIDMEEGTNRVYQADDSTSEIFRLNIDEANTASSSTQLTINGFDTSNDVIALLGQGAQIESREYNPFTNTTLLNFGQDQNDSAITIALTGIAAPNDIDIIL